LRKIYTNFKHIFLLIDYSLSIELLRSTFKKQLEICFRCKW